MICKGGVFVIRRHNELRDLEADLLSIVCNNVEVEPVLQGITEEQPMRGSHRAQDARLDQDQEPQQIYCIHENDKKRLYSRRVLDVEHGSFTPLIFTTTGGMGKECIRYHSSLAELLAATNGQHYSQTISWIQARTSFALLRWALVCLRGSRLKRRSAFDDNNCDIEIATAEGAIDIV